MNPLINLKNLVYFIIALGIAYILKNFDPQVPDRNFLWTTDYRVELPVKVKKSGKGSEQPSTFTKMWL